METSGQAVQVQEEKVVLVFRLGLGSNETNPRWCAVRHEPGVEFVYYPDFSKNSKEIEGQGEIWLCTVVGTTNAQKPGRINRFVKLEKRLFHLGDRVVCNFISQINHGPKGLETRWGCRRTENGMPVLYIPCRTSALQPSDMTTWTTEISNVVGYNQKHNSIILAVKLIGKTADLEKKAREEAKRVRNEKTRVWSLKSCEHFEQKRPTAVAT